MCVCLGVEGCVEESGSGKRRENPRSQGSDGGVWGPDWELTRLQKGSWAQGAGCWAPASAKVPVRAKLRLSRESVELPDP